MSGALMAIEMGGGKSLCAISLVRMLDVNRTLVLCPKAVLTSRVWSENSRKHLEEPITVYEAMPRPGWNIKDRLVWLDDQMTQSRPPVIAVLNYDVLDYDYTVAWILKQRFEMLICDESHKLKAPDGKRAHRYWKIAREIKYKLGLTGTPLPHSPKDAWAQYRGLDPGIFGTSITRFMDRYAVKGGYLGKEVVKWQHEDELNEKMYQIAFRVGADVLDLPPVRHEEVKIELGAKAQKIYSQIEGDFYAQLDQTHEITVANVLTQIIRQQQITSGFIRDDNDVDVEIDTAKRDALENILEEIQPPTVDNRGRRVPGEPLVVFCRFRYDLDMVKVAAEKTGFVYAELSGRKSQLKEWTNGEADVIGVQIQAGGSGIDLSRARYCVYYSATYSLGDYLQSLKRVHRPGQTRPVTYYHLVGQGVIDQDIYDALQNHANVVDRIIDRIKEIRPIAHVVGIRPTNYGDD
jgi:SNF2 family DNA or RNA helicase